MRYGKLLIWSILAALETLAVGHVHAAMGGKTIMERVDKDGDNTLSLAEVRAAAAGRYDLIQSKNGGHVTMLQLGGRLLPADLKGKSDKPSPSTTVSKEEYLALTDKFFDEADTKRKQGDPPGSGKLDLDELGSTAGQKLVGLLQ